MISQSVKFYNNNIIETYNVKKDLNEGFDLKLIITKQSTITQLYIL